VQRLSHPVLSFCQHHTYLSQLGLPRLALFVPSPVWILLK
jgi:hypothetical protein